MNRIFILFIAGICLLVSGASAAGYNITGYDSLKYLVCNSNLPFLDNCEVDDEDYTSITALTFDALEQQHAIISVHFKVPSNSHVNFTVYYGTGGASVSGYAENHLTSFYGYTVPYTQSTINFNGETKTYTFFDTNPEWDYNLAGYARDDELDTAGIIVYHAGYGSFDNDLAVYMPLSDSNSLAQYLITKIEMSSPEPFDVDLTHGTYSAVAESATKTPLEEIPEIAAEIVTFAATIGWAVYDFAVAFFKWLKFFFVDNLGLTVVLYLSLSMAYAASKARDIFDFYKRFIGFQRAFYEFLIFLYNGLISLISTFRAIFRI